MRVPLSSVLIIVSALAFNAFAEPPLMLTAADSILESYPDDIEIVLLSDSVPNGVYVQTVVYNNLFYGRGPDTITCTAYDTIKHYEPPEGYQDYIHNDSTHELLCVAGMYNPAPHYSYAFHMEYTLVVKGHTYHLTQNKTGKAYGADTVGIKFNSTGGIQAIGRMYAAKANAATGVKGRIAHAPVRIATGQAPDVWVDALGRAAGRSTRGLKTFYSAGSKALVGRRK